MEKLTINHLLNRGWTIEPTKDAIKNVNWPSVEIYKNQKFKKTYISISKNPKGGEFFAIHRNDDPPVQIKTPHELEEYEKQHKTNPTP